MESNKKDIKKNLNIEQELFNKSRVIKAIYEKDWRKTDIGTIENWPLTLKTLYSSIIHNQFPMAIWWYIEECDDLIQFGNDSWIDAVGEARGLQLGERFNKVWLDISEHYSPIIKNVIKTGKPIMIYNEFVPFGDGINTLPIERYYSYCYSPIYKETGKVGGVTTTLMESTSNVQEIRRNNIFSNFSLKFTNLDYQDQVFNILSSILSQNPIDLPFHCLYSFINPKKLQLEKCYGIEPNTPLTPILLDFEEKEKGNINPILFNAFLKDFSVQKITLKDEEYLPTCKVGKRKPFECRLYPLGIQGLKQPIGAILIGVNIFGQLNTQSIENFYNLLASQIGNYLSAIKTRKEEIKRVEFLAESDKAKTIFFQNISHEFRTPLTLILGIIEKLKPILEDEMKEKSENFKQKKLKIEIKQGNEKFENEMKRKSEKIENEMKLKSFNYSTIVEDFEMINKNTIKLLKLVNTLMDFSKIEAGKVQPRFELTNINQFTEDLCSIFRSACQQAQIEFIVSCEISSKVQVFIDKDMWEKIILNLISNAFKYTFKGKIQVSLKENLNFMELIVADTGIGIMKEEIPKLFQRFYRIENFGEGRNFEGTGIGLSLIMELVKIHHGFIQVDSEIGKGSQFKVSIPLGKNHLPLGQIVERKNEKFTYIDQKKLEIYINEFSKPNLNNNSNEKKKEISFNEENKEEIMIVDDNEDMRHYISSLLQAKYQIIMACDGRKAIEILNKLLLENKKFPDLILSDIMMPHINGFQLIEFIRKEKLFSSIPIILLSARAGEESKVEGLLSGANDYLIKPFTAKELIARVTSHLEISKERKNATNIEKELKEKAEKASQSKDRFLAVLSHELRTPLAPVLLLVEEILKVESLSLELKENLNIIYRNIKLEIQLIDDLLDLTKIIQGKLTLHKSTTNIHELLNYTLKIVQYDIITKKLKIDLQFSAQNFFINGDSGRIQQIFWNVIKNAVKFTSTNGNIYIKTFSDNEYIQIEIKDTGIGISKEDLPKIFKSFEQANIEITKQFGGLGLGLSISKVLAEMHNGILTASSLGQGKGSTFIIKLPIQITNLSRIQSNNNNLIIQNNNMIIEEKIPKLNIFLIEDNITTQIVMKKLLIKRGHNVFVAGNCSESFQLIEQKNNDQYFLSTIDLVFCDIGLPDGTGFDIIEKIRIKQKKIQEELGILGMKKKFKVFALTGYGMNEDIQKSLEKGFDAHLVKPIQLNILDETLKRNYEEN